MKVKISNENQYYYHGIFITKEAQTAENKYVQLELELIVQVLSKATWVKAMTDKFIQYRKIASLNYYFIASPEKVLILLNFKQADGEWEMVSFTQKDEIIYLPKLNISLKVANTYKK